MLFFVVVFVVDVVHGEVFVFVNLTNLYVVVVLVTEVVFVVVGFILMISQHLSIGNDNDIEAFLTSNSCPNEFFIS